MVATRGDRVRIRLGNLTMTNHPMHLHGHSFHVTGTDGGWIPKTARWPEITTDIAVGQMRALEFVADAPGDWTFHCHKAHHTMGPMGHQVPTMIGVEQRTAAEKINRLIPGYMSMGDKGMDDMSEMHMPLPENTLPMMDGKGPYGAIGMGGMLHHGQSSGWVGRGRLSRPRLVSNSRQAPRHLNGKATCHQHIRRQSRKRH